MTLTIDQLCETTAARIAALDASDYAQAGYSATWTETGIPGAADEGSAPVEHLQFMVGVVSSQNTDLDHDRAAEEVYLRTTLQVAYGYHMRTGGPTQITDERLAMRAGQSIAAAMLAEWGAGDRIVYLVSPYAAYVSPDGEWLLCTVTFDVFHDFPI